MVSMVILAYFEVYSTRSKTWLPGPLYEGVFNAIDLGFCRCNSCRGAGTDYTTGRFANLSLKTDPYSNTLRAWRNCRYCGSHRGGETDRGLGPAGGGGKPARRQRLYRHERRGQGRP